MWLGHTWLDSLMEIKDNKVTILCNKTDYRFKDTVNLDEKLHNELIT